MTVTVEGGDLESLKRLKTSYPRPAEGEEVPITFIDMREVFAGWSPELKRTVYKKDFMETQGLKRVREVILLEVYNWLLEGISFIELSEMELNQFREVLDQFIEKGGEIVYTRKRQDQWMINYFRLVEPGPWSMDVKGTSMDKLLEKYV
ncbi:hypothetical protein [Methanomethylovorans sp.]|uniref:hypothetical protein n=1 Tax=Methanomethylovorans sp. TaxID=2758717 RepID=UPI00351C7F3A